MNYSKKQSKVNEQLLNKYKQEIIKILKKVYEPSDKQIQVIVEQFPNTILEIEYTNKNVSYSWDINIAVMHLYVKKEFLLEFKKNKDEIFNVAKTLFDYGVPYELRYKNKIMYDLDNIVIDEIIEEKTFEIPANIQNDTLILALNDANKFILDKNYTSALDRIHTFFMGHIREYLKVKNIEYTENETLNQLFKKLYSYYENKESLDKKIGTILKSMTGVISSINDLRNKNSLSHPNEYIVNQRDAKLAIDAISIIINYLDKIDC